MLRFTHTESRTLVLALTLLGLGTAVRVALDPGRAEFAWQPSPTARPAETLAALRRSVDDTMSRAEEARRPLAAGETIDPNRADPVQLQRLPGVGPARAAAIVRERAENGPFRGLSDLTRVRGIGPSLIRRWASVIRMAPPAVATAPSVARPSRIDLNQAHPKELEQITGIGPALARRIVAHRERLGRLSSIEELLDVPGIGPKTLDIVREQAYVR